MLSPRIKVEFLREWLVIDRVADIANRAVAQLIGHSEHGVAAEIRGDLPLCTETLEAAALKLPLLLATT